MKLEYRFFVFCAMFLFFSTILAAQVPPLMNYQGMLNDGSGSPVTGNLSVLFSIYDIESGGTALWSETQEVAAADGYFQVLLGSVRPLTYTLFDQSDLFLALKVGDDEEMTPRKRLVSTGFSIKANDADHLQGMAAGDFIQVDQENSVSSVMIQEGAVTTEKIAPSIVSSISGVTHDGGNIDLVAGDNITITPDNSAHIITISSVASGSGGGDITSVTAGAGLAGGAESGNATLYVGPGEGIDISADNIALDTEFTDGRYVNEAQENSITAGMIQPQLVSSIDGVSNDGGNIDLVAGENISITPNDAGNQITIAATGVGTGDITSVTAGAGLGGGAVSGNATLYVGQGEGIEVSADAIALDTDFTDGRYVNVNETNSISNAMMNDNAVGTAEVVNNSLAEADLAVNVVSSLDGVSNDGGNIDLVAGENISITPDDARNLITISSTGGGSGDITSVTAGAGLAGGSTTGSATLYVGSGEGISVSADAVALNTDFSDARYVNENQANSISSNMIEDNTIQSQDIDNDATIIVKKLVVGPGDEGNQSIWGHGDSNTTGVKGSSDLGFGIHGLTLSGIGIFGARAGKGDYAGDFYGNVRVQGTLTKTAGSFKIDHPLDPENKYLLHSFVESPDMKNVYDGVITLDSGGETWVELPAWFEALNRDFRYQLTCIGGFASVYIAEKISGNRFKIAGGTPGLEVSWQVTGIRQDPYAEVHRIPVEEDKTAEERGKYVSADAYGKPESFGIGYEQSREMK